MHSMFVNIWGRDELGTSRGSLIGLASDTLIRLKLGLARQEFFV